MSNVPPGILGMTRIMPRMSCQFGDSTVGTCIEVFGGVRMSTSDQPVLNFTHVKVEFMCDGERIEQSMSIDRFLELKEVPCHPF